RGAGQFIRRSPLSTFWGCIAAAILVMALAAPVLAPYEPLKSDFRAMSKPPNERHYFGTDEIGRDVLSRVIYGSRASLTIAVASDLRIVARQMLLQCTAPYLILAPAHLGVAIIIEAPLGFLGGGIPPPTPPWGNMLADSLNAGLVPPWWLVLFPGLAITITVLAFNLLGDGIRDILDPRLRTAV